MNDFRFKYILNNLMWNLKPLFCIYSHKSFFAVCIYIFFFLLRNLKKLTINNELLYRYILFAGINHNMIIYSDLQQWFLIQLHSLNTVCLHTVSNQYFLKIDTKGRKYTPLQPFD